MDEYLQDAIDLVDHSLGAFCHYISPNDIGLTGGHQCGYYFSHDIEPLIYGRTMQKGSNYDIWITIRWQKSFATQSRAVYYGTGTRNENRITNFGRGFEFMQDCYLGSLLIICKMGATQYDAYVLSNQDNIEDFIAYYNLSLTKKIQLISLTQEQSPEETLAAEIRQYVNTITDFPDTVTMASVTRDIVNRAYHYSSSIVASKSDAIIKRWVESEYQLFCQIENKVHGERCRTPFSNLNELIAFSSSVLNRRKSRAGKSLEHHLASIFDANNLQYEEQVITEGNKKPDFIFPDGASYHNIMFPADRLVFLGAKTTCKDRWRQVLNEADRIDEKHLFTLQQGVSVNQLEEMRNEHLTLVVPSDNISSFHPGYRNNIMSLGTFIEMVKEKQRI